MRGRMVRGGRGVYPIQRPLPYKIDVAEALHGVLRGWLTRLGHPDPTATAESGPARSATS